MIISSKNDLYPRMKKLESLGIPRDSVIDGIIFTIRGFDLNHFIILTKANTVGHTGINACGEGIRRNHGAILIETRIPRL